MNSNLSQALTGALKVILDADPSYECQDISIHEEKTSQLFSNKKKQSNLQINITLVKTSEEDSKE